MCWGTGHPLNNNAHSNSRETPTTINSPFNTPRKRGGDPGRVLLPSHHPLQRHAPFYPTPGNNGEAIGAERAGRGDWSHDHLSELSIARDLEDSVRTEGGEGLGIYHRRKE